MSYSTILEIKCPIEEKLKYFYYLLAQNGFKDFLKIEFVDCNILYGRFNRRVNQGKLESIQMICQTNLPKENFEKIELCTFSNFLITDLIKTMNESHLILINLNEVIKISENKIIDEISLFFIKV